MGYTVAALADTSKLVNVDIELKNRKINAVFDTGAAISVADRSFVLMSQKYFKNVVLF